MTRSLFAASFSIWLGTSLLACGGGASGPGSGGVFGQPTGGFDPTSVALIEGAPEPSPLGFDPSVTRQWHIRNFGQYGGVVQQDLRLFETGLPGDVLLTGKGTLVAVLDGAVQVSHPDLRWRFANTPSHSYRTQSSDPSPPVGAADRAFDDSPGAIDDAHGTAVAGIIAATAGNGLGGRGVAPGARLMALDVLVDPSLSNLVDAIARSAQAGASVINNSWGPLDPQAGGDRSFTVAPAAWKRAVEQATSTGRNGQGTVVVFAAGNGGLDGDRSDYDEFTNDPNVIAVGAVDDRGIPICFSEPGANVLVTGFSGVDLRRGVDRPGIFTTDIAGPRGYSKLDRQDLEPDPDYTQLFDGTSAAAPMISGLVALMLETNPRLSWRDIRWILASTARPTGSGRCGGQLITPAASSLNAHGFHPRTGFGIASASAATTMARDFLGLGEEVICDSDRIPIDAAQGSIPDASTVGVSVSRSVGADCPIRRVEAVELSLAVDHPYSGDLRIRLTAPSQKSVDLSEPHACKGDPSQEACTPIRDGFRFGIVRFMGEAPAGTWVLRISDEASDDTGRLLWWRLRLRGHR